MLETIANPSVRKERSNAYETVADVELRPDGSITALPCTTVMGVAGVLHGNCVQEPNRHGRCARDVEPLGEGIRRPTSECAAGHLREVTIRHAVKRPIACGGVPTRLESVQNAEGFECSTFEVGIRRAPNWAIA